MKNLLIVFLLAITISMVSAKPSEIKLAEKITIVTFGDSTTAPRAGVIVYSEILKKELQKKNNSLDLINAGVPGNTTTQAAVRFEKDVLAYNPQLVIIQFGINDAAIDVWKNPPATSPRVSLEIYRQNLLNFVKTLKKRASRVILMTPNPIRWTDKMKEMYGHLPYNPNDPDSRNFLLKDYAQIVRQIAKKKKVKLIDVFAEYYNYDKVPGQKMEDLLLDGVHPNSRGHLITSNLILSLKPSSLGF